MLIHTTTGRTFEAGADETLLDAAHRSGIQLPYSCRTGRCSTCKGRELSAESTMALRDETGLTPDDRAQGWILTCVRTATADVTLEVDDLGGVRLPAVRMSVCRIQSIEKLAPDVVKVVLRFPPGAAPDYLPGQYVDVIGPGGMRRSYSIANAPSEQKLVELHIRQVPSGEMSRYWFEQAKANDLLRLSGPHGTFFLRDTEDRDIVFLATGTGIAPVKSMLEGLRAAPSRPRSVTVYWGGRRPEDLYWQPDSQCAPHDFVTVLSRAGDDWPGERGHVQDVALRRRSDWSRALVYACGSDAMIHGAREALSHAGHDTRRFHSDAFVCSAAA